MNLSSSISPSARSSSKARFAKPRILIVGCGDVGMRLLPMLVRQFRVFAATSQSPGSARFAELRAAGATPIYADLDQTHTLWKLAGLAPTVIHLAPPPQNGLYDSRTKRLAAILPEKTRLVYISTTGVYGDCGGAVFDETRPVNPINVRAKRRVDAERCLRQWARRRNGHLSILRVPGIYAENRLPTERLQKATPALIDAEDVYTNHIHAKDLAYLSKLAMLRGAPNRVYHAVDDSDLKMGEYFDLVADHFHLGRPERMARKDLVLCVSPMLLSFMSESRRLSNQRIKMELGARLEFPDVESCLRRLPRT